MPPPFSISHQTQAHTKLEQRHGFPLQEPPTAYLNVGGLDNLAQLELMEESTMHNALKGRYEKSNIHVSPNHTSMEFPRASSVFFLLCEYETIISLSLLLVASALYLFPSHGPHRLTTPHAAF